MTSGVCHCIQFTLSDPCSLDVQFFFIGLGPKVTSGHVMDFPLKVTPGPHTAAEFWLIAQSCEMT